MDQTPSTRSVFVLAYTISWLPWLLGSLAPATAPFVSYPFFTPGPLLAALIVIPITQGRAGLRALRASLLRWRVGWRWYALALGLPLLVAVGAAALNALLGAPAPALVQLGPWYMPLLAFAVRLINPTDGPLGEEPGWRGFAQPGLQAGRSPLAATAHTLAETTSAPPTRTAITLILVGCATMFTILQIGTTWLPRLLDLTWAALIAIAIMLGVAIVFEHLICKLDLHQALRALGFGWPEARTLLVAGLLTGLILAFFPVFSGLPYKNGFLYAKPRSIASQSLLSNVCQHRIALLAAQVSFASRCGVRGLSV